MNKAPGQTFHVFHLFLGSKRNLSATAKITDKEDWGFIKVENKQKNLSQYNVIKWLEVSYLLLGNQCFTIFSDI